MPRELAAVVMGDGPARLGWRPAQLGNDGVGCQLRIFAESEEERRAVQWTDCPTNAARASTASSFPAASGGCRAGGGSGPDRPPSARTGCADAPSWASDGWICGSGSMVRACRCAAAGRASPCVVQAGAEGRRGVPRGCRHSGRWTRPTPCAPLPPVPSAPRSAPETLRRENDPPDRFLTRLGMARRSSTCSRRRVERMIREPRSLRAQASHPAPSGR